jgi:hypothetical protein
MTDQVEQLDRDSVPITTNQYQIDTNLSAVEMLIVPFLKEVKVRNRIGTGFQKFQTVSRGKRDA